MRAGKSDRELSERLFYVECLCLVAMHYELNDRDREKSDEFDRNKNRNESALSGTVYDFPWLINMLH